MDAQVRVIIPPPTDLSSYGPSALFRYFMEAGEWDLGRFADDLTKRHPTSAISTDAVSDWANCDVIPRHYRYSLYRIIDELVEGDLQKMWKAAFQTVWAEHWARKRKPSRVFSFPGGNFSCGTVVQTWSVNMNLAAGSGSDDEEEQDA